MLFAGLLLGAGFVIELPIFVPALSLAAIFSASREATGLVQAIRGGLLFGTAGSAVAGCWIPGLVRSWEAGIADTIALWLLVSVWTAGLPYALLAALLYGTRWVPPLIGTAVVGTGIFAIESAAMTPPWGIPGFLLAYPLRHETGVAQLASIGDVRGLSVALAMSADLLARSFEEERRWRAALSLFCSWTALAVFGVPVAEWVQPTRDVDAPPHIEVLLVQPDFPRNDRWQASLQALHLERLADQTRKALASSSSTPDLILWPETALTQPLDRATTLQARLFEVVASFETPLVTGAVRSVVSEEQETYRNVAIWIEPDRSLRSEMHKSIAVPLLEASRAPESLGRIRALTGLAANWPRVAVASGIRARPGFSDIAITLCYEALFPAAARDRIRSDTRALVNLADDAWAGSAVLTRQLALFSSYRGIEARLPYIRLAHGGLSIAFDEFGRHVESLPLDRPASFSIEIPPAPSPRKPTCAALLGLFLTPGLIMWRLTRVFEAENGR